MSTTSTCVFCWDGAVGDDASRAIRADDPNEVRRLDQQCSHANEIWRSFCESNGGSIISISGDSGIGEVAADKLDQLPKLKEQYASAIDSKIAIGVGMKISEASKALKCASNRGGDCIVLYSQEVDKELAEAERKSQPQGEMGKLAATLEKAAPALNQGPGAGMQGQARPSMPSIAKPKLEGSEHTEGEAARSVAEDAPRPEFTNAEGTLGYRICRVAKN